MIKTLIRMLQAAGLLFALTTAAIADEPLKIATSAGPIGQLVQFAAGLAKAKGIDVKLVEMTDWVALNEAVVGGDVDANLFQHGAYLTLQNKQRGLNLVQVDRVGVIAPVGLFSHKIRSLDEVKSGDSVAIPNEPLNGARGLILLERAGLIKLTPGKAFPSASSTSSITQSTSISSSLTPRRPIVRSMTCVLRQSRTSRTIRGSGRSSGSSSRLK
jgi:D-methionine transport system substrate-binding protein